MLDTIRLKYAVSPTEEQLTNWQRRTRSTQTGGVIESYVYNPVITEDEVIVKYTYYPVGYKLEPLLTLEVSLPKLINGNNHQMIGSIDGTIKIGNLALELVQHAPKLDLAEGVLIRLDFCYNHQVGELVDDYIQAIGQLDYPHRRTKYHRYEGAEFRAKHKTTKFYNKEHESRRSDAHGILRQELTILKGSNVAKVLGKDSPTLLDITKDIAAVHLNDDLAKLRLLGNSIANADMALKVLCQQYGSEAGIYYYGLLVSRLQKSKKRIHQESQLHHRTLERRLRKIVDSKIALTLTDRSEPLPPLKVEL
ncbi:MAG: hypothetical protein KIT07_06455 [Anaerolineales bacterium]|nr:hypothetical protein [Anaerolineales bacterium]